MKPRLPNSPVKLAVLSVLGSLIAAIIFVLPWSRRHGGLFSVPVLFGVAVFAVGVILALKSTSSLKHGIENQDWPESQIEPLRNHLQSPYCTALRYALLISYALLFIATRFRGEAWVCFLVAHILTELRGAVRRPPAKRANLIRNWRDYLAPIHSDHWGQR